MMEIRRLELNSLFYRRSQGSAVLRLKRRRRFESSNEERNKEM
jgi:hypothetical protein